MKIEEDKESLDIKKYEVDGKKVANRYEVNYFNKITSQNKIYYLDIDFGNEKNEFTINDKILVFKLKGVLSDDDYMGDYEYTLDKDCQAAKASLYNPEEITCIPFVNDEGYIVDHMYHVSCEYDNAGKKTKKKVDVVIDVTDIDNSPTLVPDDPNPDANITYKGYIYKLVKNRLNSLNRYVDTKLFKKILHNKFFKKEIRKMEDNIKDQRTALFQKLSPIEAEYQMTLRKELWAD